jgi:hypothetical protein
MRAAHFVICVAAMSFISGCASVSDVTPLGDGRYTVGSEVRGGLTSWAQVRQMAVEKAMAFCASNGKEISGTSISTEGTQGWTPQSAQVTFACK